MGLIIGLWPNIYLVFYGSAPPSVSGGLSLYTLVVNHGVSF
ncbi:unnamed protein product [Brassica rapa subsp. trilocularis]